MLEWEEIKGFFSISNLPKTTRYSLSIIGFSHLSIYEILGKRIMCMKWGEFSLLLRELLIIVESFSYPENKDFPKQKDNMKILMRKLFKRN